MRPDFNEEAVLSKKDDVYDSSLYRFLIDQNKLMKKLNVC